MNLELGRNLCSMKFCLVIVVFRYIICNYHFLSQVDILLCTYCFHNGTFVIGHSCLDFLGVNLTRDYGKLVDDNWTDQEILLLLKAMEIYNENYNEIFEHVGTKSEAQCILRFLCLSSNEIDKDGNCSTIRSLSIEIW